MHAPENESRQQTSVKPPAVGDVSGGYELVDFGEGRKLERFGGRLVDRPSPAAVGARQQQRALWRDAESVFNDGGKTWHHRTRWPDDLNLTCCGFQMPLRPTPFGHVGVFPEQWPNWEWLQRTWTQHDGGFLSDRGSVQGQELPNALNLFGYTGASTMAMVRAGFRVAHVDAAKPNVQATRDAASCNAWKNPPIRFLVDDAAQFVRREVRRQRNYHTIVMDPPAYGHGPKGNAWRLERDLWPLLDDCLKLIDPTSFRLLITGHSPAVDQQSVRGFLAERFASEFGPSPKPSFAMGRLFLVDAAERKLDAGFYVRCWSGDTM